MSERSQIERLVRDLYAARVAGDLDALCAIFSQDARFQIAGASDGKPIAIEAKGSGSVRTWLAVMIKTFRIADQKIETLLIDGAKAAVHWHCTIHSRITGASVATELVDMIEVRDGRVSSYVELFAPR